MQITKEQIKQDYLKRLTFTFAEGVNEASIDHKYMALGKLIKDYVTEGWAETNRAYTNNKCKQTYYFSMEFLIGKLLDTYLINLGIRDLCAEALAELTLKNLLLWNQMLDLETVDLEDLLPALWTQWHLFLFLLMDAESVSSMVFSNKKLLTVTKLKNLMTG